MLSQEEIKNILAILSRPETVIRANEAKTLALLQQKLQSMLTSMTAVKPEEKTEEKTNE